VETASTLSWAIRRVSRRSVEQHGGGDRALSSARRSTRMIVDGRGGAEVRCWESYEDHRPG
jgi:hypothetical protein